MTLECPEERQDVNCAWKELDTKLRTNTTSQIARRRLLKGNMSSYFDVLKTESEILHVV